MHHRRKRINTVRPDIRVRHSTLPATGTYHDRFRPMGAGKMVGQHRLGGRRAPAARLATEFSTEFLPARQLAAGLSIRRLEPVPGLIPNR